MGLPQQPMLFAPAIMAAVELPSISPKVNTDVQKIFRALRPHPATRNLLSEGGASLGRTHRLGPCSGQKLAADGVRLSSLIQRSRVRSHLAIPARHSDALGGAGRPAWSGPGGGTG